MGTIASIGVKPVGWKDWLKLALGSVRELFPKPSGLQMSVKKSVPLGQKANATLLLVNGEQLLLGVTASSVCLLRKWTAEGTELELRGFVR